MTDVTFYKARKSTMGGGIVVLLIVFFGLTLPLIMEGAVILAGKLIALLCFWIVGLLLTILPLGAKLEVGKNYIKTYLFNFPTTKKISAEDVELLNYGKIFRGGLGYGNGITFRTLVNGKSKSYSI